MTTTPLALSQPKEPEVLVPERVHAMLNALKMQRDATADEVVNLVGTLAERDKEIAALKAEIAKLKPADLTPE